MSFRTRCLATAVGLLALGGAALAQGTAPAGPPTRLRGTIAALEGNLLTVASRDDTRIPVTLTEPLTVSALRRLTLAEIAPGSQVGVVGEPGPDNTLRAVAVQVFPASQRINEGQFPWDSAPNTNMTNATVSAAVVGTGAGTMALTYRDQAVQLEVPPGTPIVTPIPAARSDLVVGAPVFIFATRNAEGQFTAARITVGKDGVAPPN